MSAYSVHTLVTGEEIRFFEHDVYFIGYHLEDVCRLVGISDYRSVLPFLHPADLCRTADHPVEFEKQSPDFFIRPNSIADLINKLHTPKAISLRHEIGDSRILVYPFRSWEEASKNGVPDWWWYPGECDHPALEVYRGEEDEEAVFIRAMKLEERLRGQEQLRKMLWNDRSSLH